MERVKQIIAFHTAALDSVIPCQQAGYSIYKLHRVLCSQVMNVILVKLNIA
jgi:hypothetical protein